MTIKLPPLPEPAWPRDFFGSVPPGAYTADQLRTAQREAALMALEEAALVCDAIASQYLPTSNRGHAAERSAHRIRAIEALMRAELEAS